MAFNKSNYLAGKSEINLSKIVSKGLLKEQSKKDKRYQKRNL